MEPIRVLVVEDHTVFRQGLVALLREHSILNVVGDAGDGLEAIEKARELMPDVILMDLRLPRCSGLEATRMIKNELPAVNIVMLTMSEEDEDVFSAIKAGAKGYLLKTIDEDELVRSVLHIAQGGAVIAPAVAARLITEFRRIADNEPEQIKTASTVLTEREREILRLLAGGATNREIAQALYIAETTVKTHIRNVLEKLHLAHRFQAIAYAIREGLASQPQPRPEASHSKDRQGDR